MRGGKMKKINVTVFGDSIAKGLLLKNGRPAYLKTSAVEIVAKHFDIDIDNKSTFGQTITRFTEKNLVEEYINSLNQDNRNIVVFCIGGNDSDYDWKAIDANPQRNHTCKTALDVFHKLYVLAIQKLKAQNVEVYVCALPVVHVKSFFKNYVCSLANCKNILAFLENDTSMIARQQEVFNNKLREIAQETKTTFLDIRTPFLNVKNLEKFYAEDGLHPNEQGQQLIAQTIINFFESQNK